MKRKFTQVLLLVAACASLGTVVSCKDTSEDLRTEFHNEINELRLQMISDNATLKQALDTRITDLEKLVAILQSQLNAIKSCDCDKDLLKTTLENLQSQLNGKASQTEVDNLTTIITNLQNAFNAYQTSVATTYATKTELEAKINELKAAIEAAKCECDEAAILARLTKVEQDILSAVATAEAAKSAAETAKASAEAAAASAKSSADACKELVEQMKTLIAVNETLINTHTADINLIKNELITIKGDLATALADAAVAKATADLTAATVASLEPRVAKNEAAIAALETKVNQNTVDITQLKTAVEGLKDELTTMKTTVATLQTEMADMQDNLTKISIQVTELTNKLTDLTQKVNKNIQDIADLKAATEQAIADLKSDVADLRTDLNSLETQVQANTLRIKELGDALKALQETIAKQVTGIIIQGTTNPVFGSFSLPINMNTNVLLAYYGETYSDVYFPASQGDGNYVQNAGNVELTDGDMQMITMCNPEMSDTRAYYRAGATLFSDRTESHAGDLYVTVNPNTVDAVGAQLNLENSQAVASGVLLKPLSRTNKVLQFGATRAANNGFYVAGAYIDKSTVDKVQKIDFDKDALKNSANTIKSIIETSVKNRTIDASKSDLVAIANDMKDIVAGLRLDANAAKMTWTDGNMVDHSVYSNYAVAATAIKPLGFEALKDVHYYTLPGYERVYSLIDEVAKRFTGKIRTGVNDMEIFKGLAQLQASGAKINIKKIDLIDVDEEAGKVNLKLTLTNTVKIDKDFDFSGDVKAALSHLYMDGFDKFGNPTTYPVQMDATLVSNIDLMFQDGIHQVKSITFTYDIEPIYRAIMGTINSELTQIDKQVSTIVDFLKDVNNVLGQVFDTKDKILDGIDTYSGKLTKILQDILSKANGLIVNNINAINSRLQPVMVYSSGEKSGLLSTSKVIPTEVSADVIFIPTTWTLELAAPTCKKHVAVTNVFKGSASAQGGDAACKQALQEANQSETMNVRLNGDAHIVKTTGLKTGYIYEVAYSALDYHGKIAARKYYITVK